jgi:predicted RNase H-like HicB family nuclease
MAREVIFVVEESPEGGYEARAVGHSVFAEAETLDELRTRIQDAVRCHFEPAVRDEVIAA